MSYFEDHRNVISNAQEIFLLEPPFSSFDFVEKKFGDYDSIRRLFSLARSSEAKTLVFEDIEAVGLISEENEDILKLYPTYCNAGLIRLSFWKKQISINEIPLLTDSDLAGYAICKRDVITDYCDRWHVFEAVFSKYPHDHNCVPRSHSYHITIGNQPFEVSGLLYCQQNALNKACAQVALRSLLSRLLPDGDISYRRINEIGNLVDPEFNPKNGLNVVQMRKILSEFNIRFNDIDYSLVDEQVRKDLPYQKYAYAGLESGGGALIGFRLSGSMSDCKHIIPFYGHTFNKDTWAPNADISYFHIGENVGYVPSESWTSSFLGHEGV